MAKIAVPAFSEALQFTKREWRGIMILALKTYGLLFLFQILASIPGHVMMRPEDAMYLRTHPMSLSDMPVSLLWMNALTAIIGFFLTQWVIAPMYIAISRSLILGEPFDRILTARLTEPRTMRVTKLMWSMAIFVIPFYAILFGMMFMFMPMIVAHAEVNLTLVGFSIFVTVAYVIFVMYVSLRVYYLVPAFATDYEFTSISETWEHSRGQAWSVFKTILLGFLFYFCIMLLFIVALMLVSVMMAAVAHMAIAGKLALQILLGFILFAMIIFMLAVMVLLLPQLITASIASVYKLSQKMV
jgi:hypothetical protein